MKYQLFLFSLTYYLVYNKHFLVEIEDSSNEDESKGEKTVEIENIYKF